MIELQTEIPPQCPYMLIPGLDRGHSVMSAAKKILESLSITISLEDLCSTSRKGNLPFYRHLIIYKLYSVKIMKYYDRGRKAKIAKYPLHVIGELLGGRDHTTIIHSLKTAQDYLDPKFGNKDFQKEWKRIEDLDLKFYE